MDKQIFNPSEMDTFSILFSINHENLQLLSALRKARCTEPSLH